MFVCRLPLLRTQGLLRLNTTNGQLEQLASRVHDDGSPIAYANGLDVAADGSIYFTASTDILPARSRDGSYDTGFAWVLNNFRGGLPRWVGKLPVCHGLVWLCSISHSVCCTRVVWKMFCTRQVTNVQDESDMQAAGWRMQLFGAMRQSALPISSHINTPRCLSWLGVHVCTAPYSM